MRCKVAFRGGAIPQNRNCIHDWIIAISYSFRYLGDVVDRPKYLIGDYDSSPGYEVRLSKRGREKGESFGFDLTSMTSLRGHFIEAVNKGSRAEEAGMARGDMVRLDDAAT